MFQAYKLKYIKDTFVMRGQGYDRQHYKQSRGCSYRQNRIKKTGHQKIGDAGADVKNRLEKEDA